MFDPNITQHACIDVPSDSDYSFDVVFGAQATQSFDVYLSQKTTVFNQGENHDPSTTYACTCYSATHCVNEGNSIEANKNMNVYGGDIDPVGIWKKAIERGAGINSGWSLQGAMKLMKDLGYIDGYTRCLTLDSVLQALSSGMEIQSWSSRINWAATQANGFVVVPGTSYGHAFHIEGYDKIRRFLYIRNSYGPNYGDNGRFYVRFEDFEILFSCYAYVDKVNAPVIQATQSQTRRAAALAKGYWNGERPDVPATRLEASVVAKRVGTVLHDDEIWNGMDPFVPVTRFELQTMFERATGRKFTFSVYTGVNKNSTITRWEMAELSVRI